MASVEIVLFKGKKNKEGKHPIALRIIKDRKPSYKFLEYIHLKDWNTEKAKVKQSHHSYKQLNNRIDNEKVRAYDLILSFDTKQKPYSSSLITSILKGKDTANKTFFQVVDIYLEEINVPSKQKTLQTNKNRATNFKKFLKGKDIHFDEITVAVLKRYVVYLKTNGCAAASTISEHLSFIRKLFNRAIDEEYVGRQYYPFSKKGIRTHKTKTIKIGLNKEEIKKLEELDLSKNPLLNHTRSVFLFSFYFAGMRISDVLRLKWINIQNDRLYYKMGKNNKVDSLLIPNKAKAILAIYEQNKEDSGDYVFPDLKMINSKDIEAVQRKIHSVTAMFNERLKKIAKLAHIDKNLTNHIARHSFGNIAGGDIPVQMLQKLYRHSNLATTIGYQSNFDHAETDEALNNVLDF